MPTSLQPLYSQTITIPMSASETVADVKAKLEAITGMRQSEQAMAYGGMPLDDESATIADAGISDGGTLTLSRPLTDGKATLGSVGVPNGAEIDIFVSNQGRNRRSIPDLDDAGVPCWSAFLIALALFLCLLGCFVWRTARRAETTNDPPPW